jgi:hypothetical protein
LMILAKDVKQSLPRKLPLRKVYSFYGL